MLILSRKEGEVAVLQLPNGEEIDVVVTKVQAGTVRLGFDAPDDVEVVREELLGDYMNIKS